MQCFATKNALPPRNARATKPRRYTQRTRVVVQPQEPEPEKEAVAEVPAQEKEVDIYRDTPLRYMGYANECGEAFGAFIGPTGVALSYAVAIAYVLADTGDKTTKAWAKTATDEDAPDHATGLRVAHTGYHSADTLIWQLLASVFWPGSVIHLVVAGTAQALATVPALVTAVDASAGVLRLDPGLVERSLPTAVGLATIPFIVEPIDATVHSVMNNSFNPGMLEVLCNPVGGKEANLDECAIPEDAPEPANEYAAAVLGVSIAAGAVMVPPGLFGLSNALFGA